MGRKTWDSLPKKPLLGRYNVILSHDNATPANPVDFCFATPNQLLALLSHLPLPHFVIGGGETFKTLWEHIKFFFVTKIAIDVPDGDVFLPELKGQFFELSETNKYLSPHCTVSCYTRELPRRTEPDKYSKTGKIHKVAIGLGANIRYREATLNAAVVRLARLGPVTVSSFIETDPVGGPPGQGQYLNAAAILETSLEPQPLLETLLAIEQDFGRVRVAGEQNAPRTLDLDILLFQGYGPIGTFRLPCDVFLTQTIHIPHPRMCSRKFVLKPLTEIAPDWIHPLTGQSIESILHRGE